jgi:hypothetical protein
MPGLILPESVGVTVPEPEGNLALVLTGVKQYPNPELRRPPDNPGKDGATSLTCVVLLGAHISNDAGAVQNEVAVRGLSGRPPVKVSALTTRLNPEVHRPSWVLRCYE